MVKKKKKKFSVDLQYYVAKHILEEDETFNIFNVFYKNV